MTNSRTQMAGSTPQHFSWRAEGKVGVITIDRPDKKNPLTFESYAELRDFLHAMQAPDRFIVFESANVQIDKDDKTQMHGKFRIAKWFAPK